MNKKRRQLQEEKPDYAPLTNGRDKNGKTKNLKRGDGPLSNFNPTYNEPHEVLSNSIRSPRSQLSDIPEEPINDMASIQINNP